MSSGGQNSSSLTGPTTMRIRDAADVTAQYRLQGVYQAFNSNTPNALRNRTQTGYNNYLQFLEGTKECVSGCSNKAFPSNLVLSFKN